MDQAPASFESNFVKSYFLRLKSILFHPTDFFRTMPTIGGWASPLAFALVTHWVAAAVSYLWSILLASTPVNLFQKLLDQFGSNSDEIDTLSRQPWVSSAKTLFYQWFMGAGAVLIDPFWILLVLLTSSFVVMIGAKLFIADKNSSRIHYESILRILSFSMAPALFAVIPFVGPAIAGFYGFILLVIGIQEVYQTTTLRALGTALFPKMLLMFLVFGIIIMILIFGVSIFYFLTHL